MAAAVRAMLPFLVVSVLVCSVLSIATILVNWQSLGWSGGLEITFELTQLWLFEGNPGQIVVEILVKG